MRKLLERESALAAVRSGVRRGGLVVVEGGAGLGKTAILDAARAAARRNGHLVLGARGSELERDFAFGVVRQLFEGYCAGASDDERAALFRGPARSATALLVPDTAVGTQEGASFAVLHGLYWLTVNLASRRPVLMGIDDAHWADDASLRWLAHVAPRLGGADVCVIVTLRPDEPVSQARELLTVRAAADATVRPALLSERAVAAVVRATLGSAGDDAMCAAVHRATGGNPFYVRELLRGLERTPEARGALAIEKLVTLGGVEGVALQLAARLRNLAPQSLRLAQAIAILGDDCELRHAAAMVPIPTSRATALASTLVRREVLGQESPPRFIHPIVRQAVAQTLSVAERDAAHRAAARLLHAEGAAPGRIAAHVTRLQSTGDAWMVDRLREAARAALDSGAPAAAAELLERALLEPPIARVRVEVLREVARAEQRCGQAIACRRLEEAMALTEDRVLRAEVAAELAQSYATLFRWTDAVDVLEGALATIGDGHESLATRLRSQLIAAGLQDGRAAGRAVREVRRLSRRRLAGVPAVTLAVARGMLAILTGRPADEAAGPLEAALAADELASESWDTRAALWWSLLTAERFGRVEDALGAARAGVDRSGNARGLVAVYSTLGLLKYRLGALPEADAAARIALRVLQEGDFAPGLAFAVTVLADVSAAGGELDEAQALLDLLPRERLPAGVGTVLIPAARGRLRLAQGRAAEALEEFEACMALWEPGIWGMDVRDAGYVHARSGAAQALLALGDLRRARELAEAELADVRRFGGRRALGVALRVAGLVRGGQTGLRTLEESVARLSESPAALEAASSLVEWGAALRRAGQRQDARRALARGLDAAARCGARLLIARAREELRIAGARPRRDWTVGVEALTPSELRIVRLARDGRTNREIAQLLYLSIKTVEGHLARAYGKLGVTARTGLDRVLEPAKSRVPTL